LWPKSSSGDSRLVMILDFDAARDFHAPQPAVEQALLAVIAQGNQLVAGHGQGSSMFRFCRTRHIVARRVLLRPPALSGLHHPVRIRVRARNHLAFA